MSRDWICLCLLILCGLMTAPAAAQESTEVPFYLPTPEGWRTETIPFPLDFAPEVEYEGLEELRLSPGMFQQIKVDFWSYAFIWWVPEGTHFDAERLQMDLGNYFRGLSLAVAEARGFDPGEIDHEIQLEPVGSSSSDHAQWQGTVRTFDSFSTRKPIRLGIRIDIVPCTSLGHVAVFFQLSPQPFRHNMWQVLDDMRQEFRCERQSSPSEP